MDVQGGAERQPPEEVRRRHFPSVELAAGGKEKWAEGAAAARAFDGFSVLPRLSVVTKKHKEDL